MHTQLHDTDYETRYGKDTREHPYWFNLRRLDGRWHVTAEDRGEGLLHTHCQGFRDRREAYRLLERIETCCANGGDLALRYWETEEGRVR